MESVMLGMVLAQGYRVPGRERWRVTPARLAFRLPSTRRSRRSLSWHLGPDGTGAGPKPRSCESYSSRRRSRRTAITFVWTCYEPVTWTVLVAGSMATVSMVCEPVSPRNAEMNG